MTPRFYLQVYGCQMNSYEADVVRAVLARAGYAETATEAEADVLMMMTCSVRAHAEARALGRLAAFRASRRRSGAAIAVLGCMAQNLKEKLCRDEGADIVAGPDEYRRLPEMIAAVKSRGQAQVSTELGMESYADLHPARPGAVAALVTIMRGCNNRCSYCIVPQVKGRERSRPLDSVLEEARQLVATGTREITLLGQNVLAYNWGSYRFPDVLRAVHDIDGLARVRFLTSHPRDLDEALVTTIAGLPRVCPGLHLPVQSGSNRILELMNRGYTNEEYLDRIEMVRRHLPDAGLTTDVLVGFPTETEDDFEQTLELVERVRFDQAYMFRFSPRPGTKAASMKPGVSAADAGRRLARLIEAQNRISAERATEMVGNECELLIEEPSPRGPEFLGRTRSNRVVAVSGPLGIGMLATALVVRTSGRTPVAEMIGRELTHSATSEVPGSTATI